MVDTDIFIALHKDVANNAPPTPKTNSELPPSPKVDLPLPRNASSEIEVGFQLTKAPLLAIEDADTKNLCFESATSTVTLTNRITFDPQQTQRAKSMERGRAG